MWHIFRQPIKFFVLGGRSSQWPKKRKQHLEKFPCCAVCGSYTKPEVHHIIPVHVDRSKELDDNNLITLCDKYCHFIFGHLMSWKSWNTNIVEEAARFSDIIKNRP